MKKIAVLFDHTMMISTGILFMLAVEGIVCHLTGQDISFEWYHPISVLLAGFLCALPSLMWLPEEKLTRKQFLIRLFGHCLLLFGIVSLSGYLFHWYKNLQQYLFVVFAYFAFYVFVWLASLWLGKLDEERMNRALKEIQDEE